jgi:hypothetical protein
MKAKIQTVALKLVSFSPEGGHDGRGWGGTIPWLCLIFKGTEYLFDKPRLSRVYNDNHKKGYAFTHRTP